jgi:hypothetical protein
MIGRAAPGSAGRAIGLNLFRSANVRFGSFHIRPCAGNLALVAFR